MYEKLFSAVQQYLSRDSLLYDDEVFSLLYHDMNKFAEKKVDEVFEQKRRLAIYGVRGTGKTTAMHRILKTGISREKVEKLLPIVVRVKGASATADVKELTDLFYRSVLTGIQETIKTKSRLAKIKDGMGRYAPWIAKKVVSTTALLIPPLSLAADSAEKGVRWLVKKHDRTDFEHLIVDKNVDPVSATDLLFSNFKDQGLVPILVIDELDKTRDDTILSDFFDGNQAWFEHKVAIMSLSYTFGESIEGSAISSVRRFSQVEEFGGVTSLDDAKRILKARVFLGASQVTKNEREAREIADELLPEETMKTLVDVAAPITHLILERAYDAFTTAKKLDSREVLPEHVMSLPEETATPTGLEMDILSELTKTKLTTTDLANRLDKLVPSISRALTRMMKNDWVTRVGDRKRAYYSITTKGLSALKRKDSK